MISPDTAKAVCIEVVRVIDGLFAQIAESESDEPDGFVEELWELFALGELRLVNDRIEPVNAPYEQRVVAQENRPIVAARREVMEAAIAATAAATPAGA
jgi:hypothetical protein